MKEDTKETRLADNWRGYTLDELNYQRAVAMARMEIEKEKMSLQISDLRQHVPGMNNRGLMGKVMGSLTYLDYLVIAFRLGRSLSKLVKGFRKH